MSTAENNYLELVPISDLLGLKFLVPSYQRGYRWKAQQVKELLDDIWEFYQSSQNGPPEAFYCLQPIVVAKSGNEWVLIDGQQRLTTIYIILRVLDDLRRILGKEIFTIRYETRPDSESFLQQIDSSKSAENIDFYHMSKARDVVEEWFREKGGNIKLHIFTSLTNDKKSGKNVQVIRYEVAIGEDTDPIDVFTEAMRETQEGIQRVMNGTGDAELQPQSAAIRSQQHQLVRAANLVSHSYGREPYRRVRIFRK